MNSELISGFDLECQEISRKPERQFARVFLQIFTALDSYCVNGMFINKGVTETQFHHPNPRRFCYAIENSIHVVRQIMNSEFLSTTSASGENEFFFFWDFAHEWLRVLMDSFVSACVYVVFKCDTKPYDWPSMLDLDPHSGFSMWNIASLLVIKTELNKRNAVKLCNSTQMFFCTARFV